MSEKQFEGRSAIVTGGTRGIGKAIVTVVLVRVDSPQWRGWSDTGVTCTVVGLRSTVTV